MRVSLAANFLNVLLNYPSLRVGAVPGIGIDRCRGEHVSYSILNARWNGTLHP